MSKDTSCENVGFPRKIVLVIMPPLAKKDGIYYDDSDDRQKDKKLALIASTRHRRRRRRRPTGKLGLFGSLRSRPPQGQSLCNILVGFCVAILATVIFNAELTTQRPIYKRSADSLTGAMVRENHYTTNFLRKSSN